MGINHLPPNAGQIEVTVFGPGYGESIIVGLTPNGYITAQPKQHNSMVKRDPAVTRTLLESKKKLRRVQSGFGTLRLRAKKDHGWQIDLSETASALDQLIDH